MPDNSEIAVGYTLTAATYKIYQKIVRISCTLKLKITHFLIIVLSEEVLGYAN